MVEAKTRTQEREQIESILTRNLNVQEESKKQHQNENTLKEQFGTGSNVQTAFQFKNTKKSFTRLKKNVKGYF